MATQHGGGGSRRTLPPPRPPAPGGVRLQLSPAPATTPPSADRDLITLAQPRPGVARVRNEYIETPLRPLAAGPLAGDKGLPLATTSGLKLEDPRGRISPASLPGVHEAGSGPASSHHLLHGSSSDHASFNPGSASGHASFGSGSASGHAPFGSSSLGVRQATPPHHHLHHHPNHFQHRPLNQLQVPTSSAVVKQQPGAGLKKRKEEEEPDDGHAPAASIICRQCRKCRCDACRSPKPLPSAWICRDKCQCSGETSLDYCSCMCCVKGLLYHCLKDQDMDNDVRCADRPCSCQPHRRCARWGCVVALVPLLPCLLCYWPLKGCLKLCEAAYTGCHSQGCQCRDGAPPTSSLYSSSSSGSASSESSSASSGKKHNLDPPPNKRLLDSGAVEC